MFDTLVNDVMCGQKFGFSIIYFFTCHRPILLSLMSMPQWLFLPGMISLCVHGIADLIVQSQFRELVDDLKQPVNCVSLSNDTNCILASCLDSTLRLLDRSSGELLQEYKGHTCKSFKMDCCLTNSNTHVTSGSEYGFIYFWDLANASIVSKFRAHASVVTSELSPKGLLHDYIIGGWC
ncbi:WD40-repeat-containing domain-containing protein [Dioscorea alata]|uniref:WD40-repeat-containing domain-containing protein n=1 Tax=Dioscorea alata TaxID=55571 RepID=A0ACB7V1H4_DIOAL|nr:WD40-repeat-containing domain-containing protein [Dioscorea alata]